MADVDAKRTNFSSLLVYDVSRWGRFQDVDESAYCEYVLKRSGVRVHYCVEQFENDGSISSSVLKTLKRSMAAEYSRELSVKVFSGQCRLNRIFVRSSYGENKHVYVILFICNEGGSICLIECDAVQGFSFLGVCVAVSIVF